MNKEYYTMEELDNIQEQLIEQIGEESLFDNIMCWLDVDTRRDFFKDMCRDYDIELDEEVEEDEE